MAISHLLEALTNDLDSTVTALDLPEGTNYSDIAQMARSGEITTEGGGKQFKEIEFDTIYSDYDMEISEHDAAVLDELLTEYEGGDSDLIVVRYVDNAEGTPPDILVLNVRENNNEKACQLSSLECSYQIEYSSSYFEARPMWGPVTWADMDFELQVQYDYIPDPSDQYWGRIIQYKGPDWDEYKTGYFYQCVEVPDSDPQEFTWERIDVQPSGGSGSGYEETVNKVTSISSQSTNVQYPSALAVYNAFLSVKNRATGTFRGLQYNDRANAFILDENQPGIYLPYTTNIEYYNWYLRADSNHSVEQSLIENRYFPLMLILLKNYTEANENDIIAVIPSIVPVNNSDYGGNVAISYLQKANNTTGLSITHNTFNMGLISQDSTHTQLINGQIQFNTVPKIANTETLSNDYDIVYKKYVDDADNARLLQLSVMPEPSEGFVGKIVQYTGPTTQDFTQGYFYKGIRYGSEVIFYSWEHVDVNPGISGNYVEAIQVPLSIIQLQPGMTSQEIIAALGGQDNVNILLDAFANAKPIFGTALNPSSGDYIQIPMHVETMTNTNDNTMSVYFNAIVNASNWEMVLGYNLTTHEWAVRNVSISPFAYDETIDEVLSNNIAPFYDETLTYDVGDIVLYSRELYICHTAITTPEDFNYTHWERTDVADILSQLINAIKQLSSQN